MKKEMQLLTIYHNQKKTKWLIIFLLLSALLFLQCGEKSSKVKANNNDKEEVKIANIDELGIFLDVGGNKKIYLGQPIEEVKKIMGEPLKDELWLKSSNGESNIYKMTYEGLEILYESGYKEVENILIESKYCFLGVCISDSLDNLKQKMTSEQIKYQVFGEQKGGLRIGIALPYSDKYKYKVQAFQYVSIDFQISENNKVEYIVLRSDYPP